MVRIRFPPSGESANSRSLAPLLSGSYSRGTESSNPTLGSFDLSKNTKDSAILGDQVNAFCPRFCPRRKRTRRGRATIHPSPANLAVATDAGQRLRKPCRNPGHLRYPRLHPTCSQAACQGRARAPQSTMTKVGKSHSKGTFAGAFGNDEDAPISAVQPGEAPVSGVGQERRSEGGRYGARDPETDHRTARNRMPDAPRWRD